MLHGTPFTSYPGREISPAVSPDGTQIAFSWDHEEPDSYDIFVKQRNTATPLRLTSMPGSEYYGTWSPDGTTIAFVSASPRGIGVYLVPAIGGPPRRLRRMFRC